MGEQKDAYLIKGSARLIQRKTSWQTMLDHQSKEKLACGGLAPPTEQVWD